MGPFVGVIILNTNKREDTLACLASLKRGSFPDFACIVVDNGSTDGSCEAIEAQFPEIPIYKTPRNGGWGGCNNFGISRMRERFDPIWYFLLNEDTLLDVDCLYWLYKLVQSDTRVGCVGPLIYHADEPSIIQSAGGLLTQQWTVQHLGQNQRDLGLYSDPMEVDWISGCALMVSRRAIEEVGLISEEFFIYWDEVDWCLRFRQAGFKIMTEPRAKVWHKGVKRLYSPKPVITYYVTRNRFLLLSKHHAPISAQSIAWLQVIRTFLSWSIRPKWRLMYKHRDALLAGMLDFVRHRWGAILQ